MPTLTLIIATVAMLIGGSLIEKRFFGWGASTIGVGLILGMMYAAQMVTQTMIDLHH